MDLIKKIEEHYLMNWSEYSECIFNKEHIHELLPSFNVLKFKPNEKRNSWIYATCGMSGKDKEQGLELFILAPTENDFLINLLAAIAHYHASGNILSLGHTVNFGCAWYEVSKKDNGVEALENIFEEAEFNYIDPFRNSVV